MQPILFSIKGNFLTIAVALALSGCGTTGGGPQVTSASLTTACAGFATVERNVAVSVASGETKPSSFAIFAPTGDGTIDMARATAQTYCDADIAVPADLAMATQRVDAATAKLVALVRPEDRKDLNGLRTASTR
jgi:hypothetical protein